MCLVTIVAMGRVSHVMPVCLVRASVMVAVNVRASLMHSSSSAALAEACACVRVVVFLFFTASCFLGHPLYVDGWSPLQLAHFLSGSWQSLDLWLVLQWRHMSDSAVHSFVVCPKSWHL